MPSRRGLLRLSGLPLAALAGCPSRFDSPPDDDPGSDARRTDPPATDPPATDPPEGVTLSPGAGRLPERGWPLPARSAGRASYAPDATGPTGSPTVAWSVAAADADGGDPAFTAPVVADGRVYVGRRLVPGPNQPTADAQAVEAYDAATGERRWRTAVGGLPGRPVAIGDALVVHDGRRLHGLDRATGRRRWARESPMGVLGAVTSADGPLVFAFASGDDAVAALTPSGDEAWRLGGSLDPSSRIALADGRAYLATGRGTLVAVDAAGRTVAWRRDLRDAGATVPTAVVATPAGAVAAVDGHLHGVRRDGTPAWTTATGGHHLATDGRAVYCLAQDGRARAVDLATGDRRWARCYGREDRQLTDGFYGPPVVDGRTLRAGTLDGRLLALSTADGTRRWTVERPWDPPAGLALVGDTLHAAWGRHLVALR